MTSSVIGGTVTYTITYTATSPLDATEVNITPVVIRFSAWNYTFKLVNGTVSVTSLGTISGDLTLIPDPKSGSAILMFQVV